MLILPFPKKMLTSVIIFLFLLITSSVARPDAHIKAPTSETPNINVEAINKPSNGSSNSKSNASGSDPKNLGHLIVFPDSSEESYHNIHSRMPNLASLKGKRNCIHNLCEDVDEYPENYISDVLKRTDKFNDYFKAESLQPDIAERNNFLGEEASICQTRTQTTYPKTAPNVNKTDRIIVNVNGFKQALVLEICAEQAQCKFSEMFPNDYETSCKQRYVIKRLMALNDDNKPAFDSFEVPSCCVCTYRKKEN